VHVERPRITHGVQSGDVSGAGAIVWARCDRPSTMMVEWDTTAAFAAARRVVGPPVTPESDLAGVVALEGLPAGQTVVYRVKFVDGRGESELVTGRFATPPATAGTPVTFAWSGDTCGQGFGINPDWGGLRTYEAVRRASPAFFVHSGDMIYADAPILPSMKTLDGKTWTNVTDETLARVAESLDDFRRRFAYNLEDDHVRALAAEVPIIAQWDDHETHNNWWPGQVLTDDRYRERSVDVLSANARRALFEWTPTTRGPIQRVIHYGPDLDVFVVDLRTFRGRNDTNDGEATPMMGAAQATWLAEQLGDSRATWKIVACDQPLSLVVPDGDTGDHEGYPQGDPAAPRGREIELGALLAELHRRAVANVVWLTADVHYAAAHHYDPARAAPGVAPFTPFWEFVAGPLHAATFGPNDLDPTFGPEERFVWAPPPGTGDLAPWDGHQSFGTVHLDGASRALTVRLHAGDGRELFAVSLPAA
jgi:alkaline phosphatase D